MNVLKVLVIVVLALVLLDQLGLWLERRGLLYWRHKKSESSGEASALLELASMFSPGAKHQIVMEEEFELNEESGEDSDLNLRFK